MAQSLTGKSVAILVTDGFEQSEFTQPKAALEEAGATVQVVSPKADTVRSWQKGEWGESFDVDVHVDEADVDRYDALVLPGGVINPDHLRRSKTAVRFVRRFFDDGKPVAAICHGPQTLIEADVVDGRRMTSFPSIRTDLENAGAQWVDEEVVVDQGLVTSRNPNDLPAFCRKMIEEIGEGVHAGQTT